jgi:hypothetical protein
LACISPPCRCRPGRGRACPRSPSATTASSRTTRLELLSGSPGALTLTRTSVLERPGGPCATPWWAEGSTRSGVAGGSLSSCRSTAARYRYHHLFRDVLRSVLRAKKQWNHGRAADWFESTACSRRRWSTPALGDTDRSHAAVPAALVRSTEGRFATLHVGRIPGVEMGVTRRSPSGRGCRSCREPVARSLDRGGVPAPGPEPADGRERPLGAGMLGASPLQPGAMLEDARRPSSRAAQPVRPAACLAGAAASRWATRAADGISRGRAGVASAPPQRPQLRRALLLATGRAPDRPHSPSGRTW